MEPYQETEVVEFGMGCLHGLSAKQWIYTSSDHLPRLAAIPPLFLGCVLLQAF